MIVRYAVGFLGLRSQDVILSSFPRSGSTWLRFMICNVIALLYDGGSAVDFRTLDRDTPELGICDLRRLWQRAGFRRVVKTHREYLPTFRRNRSIGLVRDPRDVMVSSYHYHRDRRGNYLGNFHHFLRDPRYGLPRWFRHYSSWRNHWTVTVSYEDLRANGIGEFQRVLGLLSEPLPEELVREAVRRSSIERVRAVERAPLAGPGQHAGFARDGRTRQWVSYFSDSDLQYCHELAARYRVHIPMSGDV